MFHWKRLLGMALIGCGALTIIVTEQVMLAAAGAIGILGGVVVASPAARRRIANHLAAASRDEQRLGPRKLLLIAVWCGLVAGLGEVGILGVRRFVMRPPAGFFNPNTFWMAPIADAALVAVCGFLLVPLARRWPCLSALRIVVSAFGFLGFLSMLLLFYPMINGRAVLLLAAGLTVQTSRVIASHGDRFYALARRTLPYAIATVAALSLSTVGYFRIPEVLAQLPPARRGAPNVLLLVLDTVRAQNLSLYGYRRATTPWLERFAKSGVRFDLAISPSSWTLESHATMFTGEFPHELFAAWETPSDSRTALDRTHETLAEALDARGYMTAGFVANVLYASHEHGLNRGFAHYEDYVVSLEAFARSSSLVREVYRNYRHVIGDYQDPERKDAADVNRAFLDWVNRRKERPFFVFLNYFDAHSPYMPADSWLAFGPKNLRYLRVDGPRYDAERIEQFRDAYDSCVRYLDHEIGLLIDQLRARGLLENTLIIVTSDHGEQFGEHGLVSHGNSLYRPLLHVPLVISFPSRVPGGRTVGDPVSLRDLPATVMDMVDPGGSPPFRGASLARYWNGSRSRSDSRGGAAFSEILVGAKKAAWWSEWFPVYKGSMRSVVQSGFHYIRNGDGREELYDVDADPREERDVSGTDGGQRVIEQMRGILRSDHGL